jgi:hypothetical protein
MPQPRQLYAATIAVSKNAEEAGSRALPFRFIRLSITDCNLLLSIKIHFIEELKSHKPQATGQGRGAAVASGQWSVVSGGKGILGITARQSRSFR